MVGALVFLSMLVVGLAGSLNAAPAGQWTQTYGGSGGDLAASVRQTGDGGYALGGTTSSAFKLIKTSWEGSVQWERTYSVAGRQLHLHEMELTEDGGYVLAGGIRTLGENSYNPDLYLLKANAVGDTEWTLSYGDSFAQTGRAVAQTSDGGYIVVGNVSFDPPRYDDLLLVKTDASGSVLWTRTHDAGDLESAFDVQQTSDGGYVLAGYTTALGAGWYDAYLVKTDAAGAIEWERTFGGTERDRARSVQQTSDGGFILAGHTESFGVPGANLSDFYLVKTTMNGEESWARTYGGGPENEEAAVVRQTTNGGYLLVGTKLTMFAPRAWTGDVFVVFTTGVGDTAWTLTLGGASGEEGVDIVQTGDGGSAILGWTSSFGAGSNDFWLVKTGPLSETTNVTEAPPAVRVGLSAFPNPFNPSTTLVLIGAARTKWMRLTVHDAAGRLVRNLAEGKSTSGKQSWEFEASGLASGIYTATLETDLGSAHRKLVLIK